jgi:hypothetical protein
VALISVKSKYGSRSGSCAGLINFNNNIPFLFIFISDKDIVFLKTKTWYGYEITAICGNFFDSNSKQVNLI